MNRIFTKIIIASIIISVSAIKIIAQQTTFLFQTNFDNNYSAYISPINKGSSDALSGVEIVLNEDGSFEWNGSSASNWIQVIFMPVTKDKQLGASFPLILNKETENININYTDTTCVSVLDSDISPENRSLIEYSSFINQMMRERFMNRNDNPAETFNVNNYLIKVDNLINQYNITDRDVIDYLKVLSYMNYANIALFNDNDSSASIPSDFIEVLNNEWVLSFYAGINILDKFLDKESNITSNRKTLEEIKNKIDVINNKVSNEHIKLKLVESNLSKFVNSYRIIDRESYNKDKEKFEEVVALLDDSKLKNKLVRSFDNLLYTSKGSLIPDVVFKDTEGNEVNLQSFKGKYIYIDLWACWCGPCLLEAPHFSKLEKDYKDHNIEFVSLSLDLDKKAWLNKVKELNYEGNQWDVADSGFDKIMNIRGIPHFILYDNEGKLLLYNAPRPSSKEIRTIFDNL